MDSSKHESRSPHTTSDLLRKNKDLILTRWEEQVRQRIDSARKQTAPILRNALPQFLDWISSELAHPGRPVGISSQGYEIAREHGEQRADSTFYSLTEIIEEYDLLRQTIFKTLETETTVPRNERDCILNAIFQGINGASSEYQRIQDGIREQFVAVLTHDLRNPLTASHVSAQLIIRHPDATEKIRNLAGQLLNSITRVNHMIQNLLDAYRIRAGQAIPVEMQACDLGILAAQAIAELTLVHGDRFILKPDEDIAGYWSPEGLSRCIENLANNAIKYGDPDAPVTISIRRRNGEIDISVHNRGNPIEEQELAKLFKPFYRSPSAQLSGKRGWGLGLILVRGMAEAHGGSVSVESTPEKGTTFTLHLPIDARAVTRSPSP